ncbi:MAG: hypothetical protein SFX73_22095 [Kofleriaceae bacterium]|nr:hypothetical protein [Kofleriaceae bacterium]
MKCTALGLLVAAGCSGNAEPEAKPFHMPDGWERVDLSKLPAPLPATIAVPKGARVTSQGFGECAGKPAAIAKIYVDDERAIQLLQCTEYFDEKVATRAGVIRHHKDQKMTGSNRVPTGEWVVSFEPKVEFSSDFKDGHYVIGLSPRLGVMCQGFGTLDGERARTICLSLEPT